MGRSGKVGTLRYPILSGISANGSKCYGRTDKERTLGGIFEEGHEPYTRHGHIVTNMEGEEKQLSSYSVTQLPTYSGLGPPKKSGNLVTGLPRRQVGCPITVDILPDCIAKIVGLRIVLDLHITNLSKMFHATFRG